MNNKNLSKVLRELANELEQEEVKKEDSNNSAEMIQTIHETFFKPLSESRILKNIEVAERLNVSPATVTNLINSGSIETTADGRITEYHLWKYLRNNRKDKS